MIIKNEFKYKKYFLNNNSNKFNILPDLNYFYKKNTIYNEFINYFFKKLFFLKNKEKIFTKLKLTYSKSNMHLNVLSSKLIYSLSIGEFMSIIGKQNAI